MNCTSTRKKTRTTRRESVNRPPDDPPSPAVEGSPRSAAAIRYPHLAFDANGRTVVAGTRYKVLHLAGEHYHHGWSAEELLEQHPDPRPEQVHAALTYFHDHRDAMIQEMRTSELATSEVAGRRPSRGLLLERRAGRGARRPLTLYMDVHLPAEVQDSVIDLPPARWAIVGKAPPTPSRFRDARS
jgi:uncharacterized protein (DUF433 family)